MTSPPRTIVDMTRYVDDLALASMIEAGLHRERGVPGLARQVEVDLPGYGRARFDLAVPDLRWALEIDLHPTHHTLTGVHRDHLRDDGAEQCGWQVRRVGELELDQHFAATIDRLVASIGRRRHDVERRRAAGLRPVPAN